MTTRYFRDILAENLYLSASSSLIPVTNKEVALAADIQCMEYAFEGVGNDSNEYDLLFKECAEYLWEKIFKDSVQNTYLVLTKGNFTVTRLDKDNFKSYIHFILDSRTCFIASSESLLSTEDFISITYLKRPGDTLPLIHYLKLVIDQCARGATIYKLSGDGGDNYIAVHAFSKIS